MGKPNIIIFNPDQFRSDSLSHLGNKACRTPNLDEICRKDGVSFSNAFCQNPVCTPSRCSFMSGFYPHNFGHRTMHHMMHSHEPVLLKTLKDNGYFVWWGGKNDLVPADADMSLYCNTKYINPKNIKGNLHKEQYWREKEGEPGYYSMYAGKLKNDDGKYMDGDLDNVLEASKFIKDYDETDPMCVFLALHGSHPPYGVETPFYDNVDTENIAVLKAEEVDFENKPSIINGIRKNQGLKGYGEKEFKEIKRTYYGMCNKVDYEFGLIVKALKEKGIYDNTLIVFLSDHGDFTGDYGLVEKTQNTFEDCLINVPLIIKPPKECGVKPRISDALTEILDVPATICDYAGIELDYYQFGKSLSKAVSGETENHRDYVFTEGGRLKDEPHCKEVLPQNLDKKSFYYPRLLCQSTNDIMHTKAVMIRNDTEKYVYRLYEQDEYYDLINDPKETHNLINEEKYEKRISKLNQELMKFLVSTADIVPIKQDLRF